MPATKQPKPVKPTLSEATIRKFNSAFLRLWDQIGPDAAEMGDITPSIQRELCGDANRLRDVDPKLDTIFCALTYEAQEWLLRQTFPGR